MDLPVGISFYLRSFRMLLVLCNFRAQYPKAPNLKPMERRTFVKLGGAASLMSLLPVSCMNLEQSPKFKMGYQLYSIRDEMEKDPIATLKALKGMGYQDFEHYGFDGTDGSYYGYAAGDFKAILDDLELNVSSGHYPFSGFLNDSPDALKRYVDAAIKGAKTVGSSYITWPWLDSEYRNLEGFTKTAQMVGQIAEQVTDAGIGFAYHNHGFDFLEFDGKTGFEIVADNTDPEQVKLQLDLYWVMHSAKLTPAQWVEKYPGRIVMWHIKDMHKVSRDYTELGNGSIDYHKVLPDTVKSGLEYYYIEQGGNFTENSMDSARFSAAYFKKELQQYL